MKQFKYDDNAILTLLDSLDDTTVDIFLEGISFVASRKQSFSYDYDMNIPIINAMLFHISFTHQTTLNEIALRELFKNLLSNNYIVDKMNYLIKLLS